MNFPETSRYPTGGQTPISTLIKWLGEQPLAFSDPAEIRRRTRSSLTAAGLLVQLAAQRVPKNDRITDIYLQAARGEASKAAKAAQPRSVTRYRAMFLQTLLALISYGDEPVHFRAAQEKLHDRTLAHLIIARNIVRKTERDTVRQGHLGVMAGLGTIGLLTRLAHPWLLAMPSLPQNDGSLDQTKIPHFASFGAMLAEAAPNQPARLHKLQTSIACLGFCEGGADSQVLKQSADDIILVSGHCDLGMQQGQQGWEWPVMDMLIEEGTRRSDRPPTIDTVLALDDYSRELLFNITSQEYRHGQRER